MSKLQCGTVKLVKHEFQVFGYANDHWFRNLIRQGTWNEFTLSHLGQLVSPTDICLDIGANLGIMTLALSVSAHEGRVYAFEASPDTCEALKRTVQANGLTNASAHNVVVGKQTDKVKFFDMPDVRSSSFYVAADSPLKKPETFNVIIAETKSVDQLVHELGIPRVDFMKIDVEGAELDVLAGAVETLRKFRPKVVMEFNSYAFVHHREILPRRALAKICEIFDELYYFQGRIGGVVALPKKEQDLERFLHDNLLNGCVDDLLCTFQGAGGARVLATSPAANTHLHDVWLSKIPVKRIAGHLSKRIWQRMRRPLSMK